VVKAQLARPGDATLVLSTDESLTNPQRIRGFAEGSPGLVSFATARLTANTRYYYGVEVEGHIEATRRGSFRTFPAGAASFQIAFASCARAGSNGLVFETIRAYDPLLYLITGDFYYGDIIDNDPGAFRDSYTEQLAAPAQAALYQRTPVAYVWDDHDFGGNNSDGSSAAKPAAQAVYDAFVPHYAFGAGDGSIQQAFSTGRVRFVLTDMRSQRNLEASSDGKGRSILGAEQREWLKRELLLASRTHGVVVWVSAVPWIGGSGDNWGGYAEERREIAQFIADNDIDNLVVLAGDAHMLAADDGTNSNYSSQPGKGFPVYQAGALDRPGSVKGGPYSEGTYPGGGQFGLLSFDDDGRSIKVTFSGRNWRDEEIVSHSVTFARRDLVGSAAP
jgi:phosphodiesterase/alkaline phosphatase D-like protein